ncbi:hypothetical protein GCM10009682_38240 [Luedemannella flava]|uniref:DUF4350 domain-containing protein n=1 Tax=Luedemannella flava TaxID=349316 RepID=A0ABN2M7W4_9ACTN
MTRLLGRALATPFGLAALGCLVLAGWALWTGGILDGAVARQVRTSSVYAAPGIDLDVAAAEQVIGNRRLVVIILGPDDDLSDACDDVKTAAAGTVVVLLKPDGDDDVDTYGCSTIDREGDRYLGRAVAVETTISDGVDPFHDRWIDAVKVIVVNYDQLAKSGFIPSDARTISPSLPRYTLAGAAVGAVVLGAAVLFVAARRVGRRAAVTHARRDAATDSRTLCTAAVAVVAQQIIDLDARYAAAARPIATTPKGKPAPRQPDFASRYRNITADYAKLFTEIADADERGETDYSRYTRRAESLAKRLHTLAED